MNRQSGILGFAALFCLTSCVSLSTHPRLIGSYFAGVSEALAFLADSRVYHTQALAGREKSVFLGLYSGSSSNPNSLSFVAPDTSRFLRTSFLVSEDFATVTASRDNLRVPKDSWQVVYRTSAKPN